MHSTIVADTYVGEEADNIYT